MSHLRLLHIACQPPVPSTDGFHLVGKGRCLCFLHSLQGELVLDSCLHIIVIKTKQKQNLPLSHSPSSQPKSMRARVLIQNSVVQIFFQEESSCQRSLLFCCVSSVWGLPSSPQVCRRPCMAFFILVDLQLPYLPSPANPLHSNRT